jgi:hypothetical protein
MATIRIAAMIAAITTVFACNQAYEVKTDHNADNTFTPAEITIADHKSNGFQKEYEGNFEADSTGQQQPPDDRRKQPTQPRIDWDKKIIKTASLRLEVKDYKSFATSLREKIKEFGGYIAQEEQIQAEYKIENTLSIKIPVDQFDDAVTQISSKAETVNEKKINSQDVTAEFVDTRSRIEAKKQVRARYMDLLKQAKNMEEILNVQYQINGIQEQIESAAGRIEYLGHSAVFSTINLTYYQILNASAIDNEKPSFGTELNHAFRNGWSWMGDLFVGLVSIWPLLLLIFSAVVIYKRTKHQSQNKRNINPPVSE